MNKTPIEWTDYTWNPIRARLKGAAIKARSGTFCTRISPGCTHCYASTINKRFGNGLEYTVPNLEQIEFFISEKILVEPLQQRKPSRIFVGDMFDLFHEAIPTEMIAEVLRVALKTTWHTFQFLTKRADRMRHLVTRAQEHWGVKFDEHMHFGVSVEDQQRADERIPLLLQTPAAVRFLSVEPMLEAVNIHLPPFGPSGVDWVICGGESGPGARPMQLEWAESLLEQCRAANVAFFMKQFGSNPQVNYQQWLSSDLSHGKMPISMKDAPQNPQTLRFTLSDRKGGNMAEWPEHLRVREFPATEHREAVTA